MADQGSSDGETEREGAPARDQLEVTRETNAGMEALQAQQTAMMSMMMQQMNDLSARVEVAEEVAPKAVSQGGGTAQSGDAELKALKQLPYVPHVAGNPFPTRPATLETDMPQRYDLYNDETYDALSRRTLLLELFDVLRVVGASAERAWSPMLPPTVESFPVSHYLQVARRAAEHTPRGGLVPGCRVKVYWPVDDAWYVGTVGDTGPDGMSHVTYDDGDQENLDMSKEKYKVIPAAVREVSVWDVALQER
ncbi:hypothetical protein CYMTET_8872 [Cymbomonas tetramitiformis]|uniref:SGF29 C-terminal domain-containing protein n=1 Tax=Cymbomonas tetramitiformis TaxID=36881 RepID=A0AAE0GU23_9CHLO|nr:hypothetical protein CYMTET_8872 [Cymbomonas tetramitiformis]